MTAFRTRQSGPRFWQWRDRIVRQLDVDSDRDVTESPRLVTESPRLVTESPRLVKLSPPFDFDNDVCKGNFSVRICKFSSDAKIFRTWTLECKLSKGVKVLTRFASPSPDHSRKTYKCSQDLSGAGQDLSGHVNRLQADLRGLQSIVVGAGVLV